jgi:hypothetical protein
VQVIDQPTTFTAPADSGYGGWYGPEVPVGVNPDCDSAKVAAEILNRALNDLYGQIDGYIVDMDITLENVAKKDEVIGGLKQQVEKLRARVEILIKEPPKETPIPQKFLDERKSMLSEIERLKSNQETHGTFWFIGYTLCVVIGTVIVGVVGSILLKFRGLLG